MVSLTYEGNRYYYCMITGRYYDSNYKKITLALSQKLNRANKDGSLIINSKKPEEEKKEDYYVYFKDDKNQKLSKSELDDIFENKQSRHEKDVDYLRRIKKKYNLKWATTSFSITANKNSSELKKLLSKELIVYTCQVIGNRGTFSIELPLFLIDYQTILERIDTLVNSSILSK